MPRGPKGEKRPRDVIGNAVHVMRIATGEIEVHVVELTVFNKSETPPFEVADSIDTNGDQGRR